MTSTQPTQNPFSTRYTKPGAIPYQLNGQIDLGVLVDKFADHDFVGQILGPHGSGKSTLVASLLPLIKRQHHPTTIHQNDDKKQIFRSMMNSINDLNSNDLLVIDGFEQLSSSQRSRLIKACRQQKAGLLVTAHEPVNLPTLFEMPIDLEVFRAVVAELQKDSTIQISQAAVDQAYEEFQPNLREALFRLYDVFEMKRRQKL